MQEPKQKPKTLCMAPWTHTYLSPQTERRMCCASREPAQNFEDFDEAQDFFEGRNVNHEKVYLNLNYEQFRWDNRSINYYIDDSGNLVARVNEGYEYPTGV